MTAIDDSSFVLKMFYYSILVSWLKILKVLLSVIKKIFNQREYCIQYSMLISSQSIYSVICFEFL